MGNTPSNTGRGDEPTHVRRDNRSDDTKREHRPVSSESTNSEDEAEASNRKSNVKPAPESSYSYITLHPKMLKCNKAASVFLSELSMS